jgi:2-phospho-L-lactate guanylyltransferase
MKTVAIVPVKELDKAKSRLSKSLTPEYRKGLLFAMLDDVLSALKGLPTIVISPQDISLHLKEKEVNFVLQRGGNDLNSAVEQANRAAIEVGAAATLFIPADMPLATKNDIDNVLALGKRHQVVITRSTDGGTGILFRRPPDVIESRFTGDSFSDHLKIARSRDIDVHLLNSRSLSLDIDTFEDLKSFMENGEGTRTYSYLKAQKIDF